MNFEAFILTIHVLAAGTVFGGAAISAVLYFNKKFTSTMLQIQPVIGKASFLSIVALFVTGFLLIGEDLEGFVKNPVFLTKMGLVVASGITANLLIEKNVKKISKSNGQEGISTGNLGNFLILELIILIGIITLGVLLTVSR